MRIETIDKECFFCEEEAKAKIKPTRDSGSCRTLELCSDCAKKLLWELIHNDYQFDDD